MPWSAAVRTWLIVFLGLALLPAFTVGAGASSGSGSEVRPFARSVTVTPADGLRDGQQVQVDWSGFPPGGAQLRQCGDTPRGRVCTLSPTAGVTGPDGRGSTTFTVRAGDLGGFTCDPDHPCYVKVGINANDPASAFGRITFAGGATTTTSTTAPPTTTTVPPTTTTTTPREPCEIPEVPLRLSGEDAAELALQLWASVVCHEPENIPLDFTELNSRGGRHGFIRRFNDVGVTALSFRRDELDELRKDGRADTYVYVPVLASALVCPFNIQYADATGVYRRLPALRLSAEALAGILNASYPNMALHPALDRDNRQNPAVPRLPDGSLRPKALRPSARADFAYATWLQTSWFYADEAARRAWERPSGGRFKTGRTESFPAENGVELRVGAAILARLLRGVDSEPTAGGIACIDSSVAAAAIPDLPLAELRNPLGEFVAPDRESISRALEVLVPEDDGTHRPRFTRRGYAEGAYPLPTVTYLIVPKKGHLPAETMAWVRRLLAFALDEGQREWLPPGYVPLTPNLRRAAEDAIRRIDARPPATTSTSTSTTTTTPAPPGPVLDPPFDGGGLLDFTSGLLDGGFTSGGTSLASASSDPGTAASDTGGSGTDGAARPLPMRAIVRAVAGRDALPVVLVLVLGAVGLAAGPALQYAGRRRRAAGPGPDTDQGSAG